MRDRMQSALGKARADYVEIRIERGSSSWLNFRGKELDSIGSSTGVGGIVRAAVNGGWGLSTFNEVEDLGARVEEACANARLAGREETKLAEVEPVEYEGRATLVKDFRGVSVADKKRIMGEYNDLMLASHEKVQTTSVFYRDSFRHVWYLNSLGAWIEEERPDVAAGMSCTAREGNLVQRAFEGAAGRTGLDVVENLHEKAERAARRAVDLLSAPPVKGGTYTVVTDPKLAGVFAHEAFGHLSESDFVYENEKLKQIMVLGKTFGTPVVNIIDDGSIPGERGSIVYDQEGVRSRENYLIREGVLVGRLHNRETAAKMGEALTGSARAINGRHPPIVRMTNTYIGAGASSFADMIADVDLGVYALDMIGGQTMMEMFTFSAAWAYMIRQGKVAEMVRDVVLTGNVFETLKHIDAVGSDLTWYSGPGGCGKGGQSPLSVGLGGPHVRIRDVVVGGER